MAQTTASKPARGGQQSPVEGGEKNTGVMLVGLSAAATVGLSVWAQSGPGFDWDGRAAAWIRDASEGLESVGAAIAWPLHEKWPFALAVLGVVLVLSGLKHKKPAVWVLSSVSVGLLIEGALHGLSIPLAPSMTTVLYGSLGAGLAMGLDKLLPQRGRWAAWGGLALGALACLAAVVGLGGMPSAWLLSVLLVLTQILILHQLIEKS